MFHEMFHGKVSRKGFNRVYKKRSIGSSFSVFVVLWNYYAHTRTGEFTCTLYDSIGAVSSLGNARTFTW